MSSERSVCCAGADTMPMHMGGTRDEAAIEQQLLQEEARLLAYWEDQMQKLADECERAELLRAGYGELMYDARPPPTKKAKAPPIARYIDPSHGLHGSSRRKTDWSRTRFWEHLCAEEVLAPERASKEFKNLTRLPRAVFDEIVLEAARSGLFAVCAHEPVAKQVQMPLGKMASHTTPLALKIMACLRHLATGEPLTSVEIAANLGKDSVRGFFHGFVQWFVDRYWGEKVVGTSGIGFSTVEEVEAAEAKYRQLGLPGIVCSMDGVHVAWDKAPYKYKFMYSGKEGYCTVCWNVHVLPTCRIVYVAPCKAGASNDKTAVRFDALVGALRKLPLFTERQWRVHGHSQQFIRGSSALCDNGYHRWVETICGHKHPLGAEEIKWASRCESVRKDTERTFGMMKVHMPLSHWLMCV